MQYRDFGKCGYKVSALGMGCMRLPRKKGENNDDSVDNEKAFEMIRYACDNGVSYFDSAYSYHNRKSEEILGEALDGGRREKVKIGTKQPFGVMSDLNSGGGKTIHDNMRRNLENTLKKLRTSYIDVYLIHNLNAESWEPIRQNRIIEEYEKYRAEGLIRAIGFSYHGNFELFSEVMNFFDWDMCQMQQNFLDENREATGEGVHLAGKKNCALVIMEPLRGGGLASAPKSVQAVYDEHPKKRPAVEWAFRHLLDYSEVSTILSGMTAMEQLKENIEIFSKPDALPGCISAEERAVLGRAKAAYESIEGIPCTGCEYCLPCPHGVNIPAVFAKYNDGNRFGNFAQPSRSYMFMSRAKQGVSCCAACGECEKKCPQRISIAAQLKIAHNALKDWVEY